MLLQKTMEIGSISRWILKEGDKFEPGSAICEVETDKATVSFDATDEGYIAKILVGTGEVKVGKEFCNNFMWYSLHRTSYFHHRRLVSH